MHCLLTAHHPLVYKEQSPCQEKSVFLICKQLVEVLRPPIPSHLPIAHLCIELSLVVYLMLDHDLHHTSLLIVRAVQKCIALALHCPHLDIAFCSNSPLLRMPIAGLVIDLVIVVDFSLDDRHNALSLLSPFSGHLKLGVSRR